MKRKILLTDEQHLAFIDGGAVACPYCGVDGLYPPVKARRVEGNSAIQALLECPKCGALVLVRYELVGIVTSKKGTKG